MKLSIAGVKVEEEMSRIFFSKGEISFQGLWGVLYLLLYRSHCWLKFLNSFGKTVGNFCWVSYFPYNENLSQLDNVCCLTNILTTATMLMLLEVFNIKPLLLFVKKSQDSNSFSQIHTHVYVIFYSLHRILSKVFCRD